MHIPRVISAKAVDSRILEIEFDNHQKKHYDITPLLSKEVFSPLDNPAIFRAVNVEKGGYGISWSNEIDLSEYELWQHGSAKP